MAVQEDVLPIDKMVMALVLGTLGAIICVFSAQVIYLAVQHQEDEAKIESAQFTEIAELRRAATNALHEYRVVDKKNKRISIPIEQAMDIVARELAAER